MDKEPTFRELRILNIFRKKPTHERTGSELMDLTKIPSGNMYVILRQMEARGLLSSCWEDADPKIVGRNLKRFYTITPVGIEYAKEVFSRLC